MSKANLKEFLQQRGHSWSVRVKVPTALVQKVGLTHLRHALGTRDLDLANALKPAVITAMRAYLDRIHAGAPVRPFEMPEDNLPGAQAKSAPILQVDPAEYREALLQADADDPAGFTREGIESLLRDRLESECIPEHDAVEWFRQATAPRGSCTELLDEWLGEESSVKEQTKLIRRRTWRDFAEWYARTHRTRQDLYPHHVTDDTALRYFDHLRSSGFSPSTVRGRINGLSAFWSWLASRRKVGRGVNPWKGFQIREGTVKKRKDARPARRPYTTEELVALLEANDKANGRPTAVYLRDLIRLMLVTGLRINEACSLHVRDVTIGRGHALLKITDGKTEAAVRTVAVIRKAVLDVLRRRLKGKKPVDRLFEELSPGGPDGKLSWSAVKAFTRYRRECGIEDGPDAHSLRRNFITCMEQTSNAPVVAQQRFLGHEVPTMMHRVYSGGASDEQMIEVARSVKFPRELEAKL